MGGSSAGGDRLGTGLKPTAVNAPGRIGSIPRRIIRRGREQEATAFQDCSRWLALSAQERLTGFGIPQGVADG